MTTNRNIGVSLTADPSQMQAGLRTASSAAQQFAATTNEAFGRASAAGARLAEASKGVAAASSQQTIAARAHQAAADRFVRDLERQAAAIGKTRAELMSLQAAELGVADRAAPLIAKLRESERALAAGTTQMSRYGMSAAQTANVMRMVPAQITDVVVSLQAGQAPMTVLLQQGGQLRDMFGGVGNAAHALGTTMLKMVNPYVLAGAAVAGLYAAYRAGAAETEAFNRTIIMTGGVAGVTADQLNTMAERVGAVSGTQRQAAAALNEMASSGRIASQNFEQFAASAIMWEKATGTAVADTVKQLEELGKAPVDASLKLNESMNYLTASTYQQINALKESGRHTEAANLAQQEYDRVLRERAPQMVANVGTIERAWIAVKGAVSGAINAMLDIGRPQTLMERLASAQKDLNQLMDGAYERGAAQRVRQVQAKQAEIADLQERIKLESRLAAEKGQAARQNQEKIAQLAESEKEWAQIATSNLTKKQQQERDILKIRETGLAIGKTEKEIEEQIAAYRARTAEKPSGGISTTETELARLRAAVEAEKQREQQLHASGVALAAKNEHEKAAIQYGEKLKLVTDGKTKAQLLENKALAEEAGTRKRANDAFDKELKERESAIDAAQKQTLALRDQIEMYGMGKSAVEAMTIARLEERIAMADPAVSEAQIDSLKRELTARRELYDAMRTKEALDAQLKEWQTWEREVDRIFDQLGQSLTDQLFEGGVSARDLLKDLFKSTVFRVAVQPVMGAMQGWVTNQLGGMFGYQNPQQQGGGGANTFGMAQNASSLYSAMTGGISTTMGNGISWLGAKLGSEALSAFGLGMSGAAGAAGTAAGIQFVSSGLASTMGAAAAPGAYTMASVGFEAALGGAGAAGAAGGAAGAAGTAGAVGTVAGGGAGAAGAALAAAAPWVLGGLAVASLLSGSFEGEDRFGNTYTYQDGKTTPGSWAGDPGAEVNNAGSQMVQTAVDAINSAFAGVGSSAFVSKFYGEMETSEKDRGGVNSGGYLSGIPGLGATPEQAAARLAGDEQRRPYWHQITPEGGEFFGTLMRGDGHGPDSGTLEEMAQYLQTDLMQTVIQAWQLGIDEFPAIVQDMIRGIDADSLSLEQASAVVGQVQAIIGQVQAFQAAVESLPFANLRDLSFDAAAGLIAAAGGLENLNAGMTSYYQTYYSDAEQLDRLSQQLSASFAGIGMEMPDVTQGAEAAKQAFRALFESIDPTTEAGQQAAAVMLSVNQSFAQLATGMEELQGAAVETERALADIAKERESLERQYLSLMGDTTEIRRRDLLLLDESNRALQSTVWNMQDFASAVQRTSGVMQRQAGLMSQLYQAMGNTQAVRAQQLAGMDPESRDIQNALWGLQDADSAAEAAYRALANSVAAEKARLKKEAASVGTSLRGTIDGVSESVRRLSSLAGMLQSTLQGMVTTGTDPERDYGWARERLSRAVSVATLTGVLPEGDAFEAALQMVAQPSEGLFRSFEDYQAEFLGTAHDIEKLQRLTDKQLTTEERSLQAMERQISASQSWHDAEIARLDAMLAAERERIDIAKGTYEATLSIPEALSGIGVAIESLASSQRAAQQIVQTQSKEDQYFDAKLAQLVATGSMHGGVDWSKASTTDLRAYFATQGLTAEEHWRLFGQHENLKFPGFAVGTNYVPYDMTARIHEGERIIPAADNRELMRALQSRNNDNALRLVQQELREMRRMQQTLLEEIGRNTNDTARTNRQMTEQPQPVHVTNVVPTIDAVPGT